jgi:ComF family protein
MGEENMKKNIHKLIVPVADLVFPPVCACCGQRLIDRQHMICEECLNARFEKVNYSQDTILPNSVSFNLSLWRFDKYGYLQNLLHKLKYDHCTGIGVQLGYEAGRHLMASGIIQNAEDWALLAVPLHKKRYRKRGYNQSEKIAKGVADSAGISLITEGFVRRIKITKTQTGLNSDERTSNISGAFEVTQPSTLGDKQTLLVDDVFTTGATTFELAQTIYELTGRPCGILTIAKA